MLTAQEKNNLTVRRNCRVFTRAARWRKPPAAAGFAPSMLEITFSKRLTTPLAAILLGCRPGPLSRADLFFPRRAVTIPTGLPCARVLPTPLFQQKASALRPATPE